jgi:hypothetical protein
MKLLNKNVHFWMTAIVRNNEIILHLATHPRHRNIQPNYGWLQKKTGTVRKSSVRFY